MRLKYLASLPLLFAYAPAMAQDESSDEPVIVVTGRGLEQTPATPAYDVVELERDKIVSGASGRIEDVLMNVAGFQQFRRSDSRASNPSAQGVTLRALGGNATSRAQVLLDAVPIADPFFGYIPLSAIAPERLESIRVTRGGGTGPFGAGEAQHAFVVESHATHLHLEVVGDLLHHAGIARPAFELGPHRRGHALRLGRGPEPLAAVPAPAQHRETAAEVGRDRGRKLGLGAAVDRGCTADQAKRRGRGAVELDRAG